VKLGLTRRVSDWTRIVTVYCLTVAGVATGHARRPGRAQEPTPAQVRNFDARVAPGTPELQGQASVENPALAAFSAGRPDLAVSIDDMTGATSKLYDRLGYLTGPDPRDASTIALDFIQGNLAVLGLDQADLTEYEVRDLVVNQATGSTHLYLRQQFQGIPLYNGLLQVNVNRDGRITSVNNAWVRGLAAQVNALAPGLDASEAVNSAAKYLGLAQTVAPGSLGPPEGTTRRTQLDPTGISIEPLEAELAWLPIGRGDVRLVWNFQVHSSDLEHAYDLTVDAVTGDIWTRFDWVSGDSYRVYQAPAESPIHVSPSPPLDGRTLVSDPANATASPFGWHDTDGVSGAEFTIMRGNNVHAYIDSDANNTPPSSEPDCGASLNCDFTVDLTQAPSAYEEAAVANLFYWNNYIHDVQYQYGFTETAGNFQVNNYGKGGVANDDVRAEAQDGAGINNANFLTPSDGSRPRMQMFLWNRGTPNIDGDFDNGIIVHEYGHGISNRLVGGPSSVSCLNNSQQPGEGLSDWWSLVYTAKTGDAGTTGRGIGTYALSQSSTGAGIRTQRYSTDPSINTWNYASINGQSVPHGVGSVWAQAAWEMYWALVDEYGFDANLMNGSGTAGNQRAMLYVNEGLMNTSCSPTFTDVRDGIIQAANDNFDGADACRLWQSFATFGLGDNAVSGGSGSTSPTNGFGLPAACLANAPTISITDARIPETNAALAGATANFTVSLSASSTLPVTVDYATANGTATATTNSGRSSNTDEISVPASGTSGTAGPYPSTITVPTTSATLSDVNVTLTGFSHTFPADVDVLLVGPTGASVVLMSDVGGGTDVSSATLVFDDAGGSFGGAVTSGTYRPTNANSGDNFPSPAPSDTPGTALSVFNDTNPSGTWSLYINDDAGLDAGTLLGGWSVTLAMPATNSDYVFASGTLTFSPGTTSQVINVTVNGDNSFEPNETFFVNLTNASNATFADAQGVGTIVNDDTGAGVPWTDDPITVGVTTLKAVHITELRTRIDALRTGAGLDGFPWTDTTLASWTNIVKAIHLTELRTALGRVYTAGGQTQPSYTDATLTAGTSIRAVHITELRAAVVTLE